MSEPQHLCSRCGVEMRHEWDGEVLAGDPCPRCGLRNRVWPGTDDRTYRWCSHCRIGYYAPLPVAVSS